MTHIRHSIRAVPLAYAVAVFMLAACSSGGSGSSNSSNPSPNDTTGVTPIGKVANGSSNTAVTTSQAVSSLGSTLQNANIPGLPGQTRAEPGGTVGNVDKVVSDLGLGVQTGLNKMGQNPGPTGTTVVSTGNIVTDLGQATVNAGSLVQGLGQGSGAPLASITQPVSSGVQQVDQALIGGGTLLGSALSSGTVQQATQQLSTAIVSVITQISGVTQMVGDSTGLGGALNNLLGTVDGGVAGAGNITTGTGVSVVSNLGLVVILLGATVAITGGIATTGGSAGGNSLGDLSGRVGGSTSGSSLLAPSTGPLGGADGSNPLAPVAGALSGAADGSSLLAPVVGLLDGMMSAASGASGGNPLAPVTNLLGGISNPVY